jgi:hypothetical protein
MCSITSASSAPATFGPRQISRTSLPGALLEETLLQRHSSVHRLFDEPANNT